MSQLIRDTIHAFGRHLIDNDKLSNFPVTLVIEFRRKFYDFWKNNIDEYLDIWKDLELKVIIAGSLIAKDLGMQAKRFICSFDKILIRDPLCKLFLLEPYKSSPGFRSEIISYLNVFIEIEKLIENEKIYLYPPAFLIKGQLKKDILNTVEMYCHDNDFINMALFCPDRGFAAQDTIEYYQHSFNKIFSHNIIDSYGDIKLFTKDYIIKTMAHDLAITQHLSEKINAIPIICLGRHWNILKYYDCSNDRNEAELAIKTSSICSQGCSLENENNINYKRELARHLLSKSLNEKIGFVEVSKCPIVDEETLILRKFILPHSKTARRYIKAPFKSLWRRSDNRENNSSLK